MDDILINILVMPFIAPFLKRADQALDASIELQDKLKSFNKTLELKGFEKLYLSYSISLSIGNIILGIIGNEQQLEGHRLGKSSRYCFRRCNYYLQNY